MRDEENLPVLSPAKFYILLVLAAQPLHGYGLMWRCRQESGGGVALRPASLYLALKDLLKAQLIAAAGTEPPERSSRVRKLYELTPMGRVVLELECERWERAAKLGRKRLYNEEQ